MEADVSDTNHAQRTPEAPNIIGGVPYPGKMKLVYVKRWRTLIPMPEAYADEILAALRAPVERQRVPDGEPLIALRIVLANQLEMMSALHQLMSGFLAPDPLAMARLSTRIQATRVLAETFSEASPMVKGER